MYVGRVESVKPTKCCFCNYIFINNNSFIEYKNYVYVT